MDIEDFKKLEKVEQKNKKCAKIGIILENAEEKIRCYNHPSDNKELARTRKYNDAYKKILNARRESISLVNEDGSIDKECLKVIVEVLIEFKMNRGGKMGNKHEFLNKLSKKLDENKQILKKFRDLRIESERWKYYKDEIGKLYNDLSTEGDESLSADKSRFDVGATKIMNFLFPELFVMVDSNVANTLNQFGYIKIPRKGYTYYFSFEFYWEIMEICRKELEEYQKRHGNLQRLLDIDDEPTTLTRIFDKCAFVMAKKNSSC